MFRKLFRGGKPKSNRVISSEDTSTLSRKDQLFARFEHDTGPICQQAIVHPFRRFDGSHFTHDLSLEAVAVALAMTTYEWLTAVFDREADFYPGVRPTDEICADLSAFITARLAPRAKALAGKDVGAVCEAMYISNEKSRGATAILREFESAEHDPNDPDLSLKWARTVRTAVDSLIVGDVDKYVTAENGDAVMRRIVVLPTTLPYDDVLPDTIDALVAEMESKR